MQLLTLLILIGLVYGFVRFMRGFIKELAEFAAEAWHQGEIE